MYDNVASYYDKLGWNNFSLKMWDFVTKNYFTEAYSPKTHLDIACGTGSVCIKAKKEGIASDGIDISISMLNMARRQAEKFNEDINFQISDARRFNTGKQYEIVTCFSDSVNHLMSKEDLLDMFKCVRTHLRNGGLFVFDMSTLRFYKEFWNGFHFDRDPRGHYIIQKSVYMAEKMMNRGYRTTVAFFNEEADKFRGFEETVEQRAFDVMDVSAILRDAGFYDVVILNLNGNVATEPNNENKLIFVCR